MRHMLNKKLRNRLKRMIRRPFRVLGLDVHRLSPNTSPSLQLIKGLEHFRIDLVLDIGANTGQFASELRSFGYRGRIVSFEPLLDAYQQLVTHASRDSLWDVHTQCAIGDFDGNVEMNIAGNSASSSVLPMLETHSNAAKASAYVGKVITPISRLDSVAKEYLSDSANIFLKIDTQGFEWEVLDGARDTLAKARGVSCELSLVPLYEGQRLWMECIDRIKAEGFTLWSIQKGFTDPHDGRTLQIDAIFYRDNSG